MLGNQFQSGMETARLVWSRLPTSEEAESEEVNSSKRSDGTGVESLDYEVVENYAYMAEQVKFILTSKLTVEGPLRMKEESVEGVFEMPKIKEEAVPEQLIGALNQAVGALQQLSLPRDLITSGMKIPLSGVFQRLFMISYLDDEILILRDTSGVPEILTSFLAQKKNMIPFINRERPG